MVENKPTRTPLNALMFAGVALLALTAFGMNSRAAAAGAPPAQAEASKSVWDGVYTADQSKKGQNLANASCVVCHGDSLAGSDLAPALLGEDFRGVWRDLSVAQLFDKIQVTMPADAAGTLNPQQVSELIAYIFRLNEYPAGNAELSTDLAELKQIRIRAK